MLTLGGSACIARPPDRVVSRRGVARRVSAHRPRAAEKFCLSGSGASGIPADDAASHERGAERDGFVLSRRAFGPSIAATLLAPIVPSSIEHHNVQLQRCLYYLFVVYTRGTDVWRYMLRLTLRTY